MSQADTGTTNAVNRLRRRLTRLEGPVNVRARAAGPDRDEVAFTLGFPEGSLVEISRFRSGAVGDCSVILNAEQGIVENFCLRFPPLPADEYDPEDVREIITDATAALDGVELACRVEAGTGLGDVEDDPDAWWPHVELDGVAATAEPGAFGTFLNDTYEAYKERVFAPEKTVRN